MSTMKKLGQSEVNPPGNKPNSRWGCSIAFVVAVILSVLIFKVFSPSDWVEVTVGPFPKEYKDFCLIAEDASGVGTLHWYHSKVFPFTMDPSQGGGYYDFDHDGVIPASVQWREAKRYGVLIRIREDQWQLWWLGPNDVKRPSFMRHIFEGGRAEMRLPAGRAETPSGQLLEQLGFSLEPNP
jgi:hypothetical protein